MNSICKSLQFQDNGNCHSSMRGKQREETGDGPGSVRRKENVQRKELEHQAGLIFRSLFRTLTHSPIDTCQTPIAIKLMSQSLTLLLFELNTSRFQYRIHPCGWCLGVLVPFWKAVMQAVLQNHSRPITHLCYPPCIATPQYPKPRLHLDIINKLRQHPYRQPYLIYIYIYRYSHSPYRTSSPSQHNTLTQTATQYSPNRHSNSRTDKCGPERGILPLLHCCCSMHLAFSIRVEPTNRTDMASRPSLYKAVLLKVVATWQCLSSKSLILSWLPQGHKKGRPIIALQNTAARLAL